MNNWGIHVEGFGKIREADIEVGSFTMFTGDNNSGKSYLMTLIWGIKSNPIRLLINPNDKAQLEKISSMDSYRYCEKVLFEVRKQLEKGNSENIDLVDMDYFEQFYNDLLFHYKDKMVKKLFCSENVSIDKIIVTFNKKRLKKEFKEIVKNELIFKKIVNRELLLKPFSSTSKDKLGKDRTSSLVGGVLFFTEILILSNFEGKEISNGSANAYFPTSRTGFVLSYKMLMDYVVKSTFNSEYRQNTNLTMPCQQLLQNINWLSENNGVHDQFKDITEFMEKQITSGKIELGSNISTELFYYPAETQDQRLEMKLCSGVVTEVALVIMFLKHLGLESITIEEPEMCLHPKLQWQYARAFIKMYNAGLSICMATHSDIFMAHVNNMIQLKNNPDKEHLMEEYDYDQDDLISAEDVKVYHFDVQDDGMTKITSIEADENGFKITLNARKLPIASFLNKKQIAIGHYIFLR